MRLFVAVNLPDDIIAAIGEIQAQFKRLPFDVKWTEAHQFHLTLKFLGDAAETALPGIAEAMAEGAGGMKPFSLAFSGLGVYPDIRRPKVIWLGTTEGGAELRALARRLDEALAVRGFEREAREFSPHVTLGRVRTLQNMELLANKMHTLEQTRLGPCMVSSVDLMSSIMQPGGHVHECVRSISI